jgi:putative membrane protein
MAAMLAMMTVACGQNTVDTTAGTAVEMAAEQETQQDTLASTVVSASNIASAESEAGKVETVYVTADANGAVNDIIVSEWLKNATAASELSDTTELKDIVNVKGDETFTDNGDGTLTWNAEGSDIYYQGTTDKQLPVKMKITYTLDGKEISPQELAGRSGKVTMRFEYENNAKQTVEVKGKEVEVYTPFAMVSGMMLDSDKFANVEISNGKVISDGGNIIVMGVALPGLKESLDISDENWDKLEDADEIKDKLSNYFEITADTTDFELGMTITMASSDILSDFGVTDLSESDKINDLKDDMEELNDGSNKLVDGTKKLKDGTTEFKDGTKKLYDGAGELKDGTQKLYDGTGTLLDGTGKLADGAGQLYDGTGSLEEGTGKLADGVKAYTDGVSKVNEGASSLAKGAASAQQGSKELQAGIGQAQAGAKALSDGAPTLQGGVHTLTGTVRNMFGMISGMDLNTLKTNKALFEDTYAYLNGQGEYNGNVQALVTKLSGGQITDKATLDECRDAYNTTQVETPSNGGENELDLDEDIKTDTIINPNADDDDDDDQEGNNGQQGDDDQKGNNGQQGDDDQKGNNGQQSDDTVQPANGTPAPANTEGGDVQDDDDDDLSGDDYEQRALMIQGSLIESGASSNGLLPELNEGDAEKKYTEADLQNAVNQAKQQTAAQYQEAIAQYQTGIAQYELGIKKLKYAQVLTGVSTGYGILSQIDVDALSKYADAKTIAALNAQLDALDTGVDTVTNGSAQLTEGLGKVYTGSGSLVDGLGQLTAGANQLAEGTNTLASKNGELVDGVSQLHDGAGKLRSGAGDLKDGADKLNSGAGELNDGARKLNDGTGELKDGTKELYDGSIELDDGVKELLEGMTKFDKEGIKKIYEAFDGDLTEFTDRLEAIQ